MEDLYNNLNTSTTIVNDCLIITLPNDIIDKEIEIGINRYINDNRKKLLLKGQY